MNASRSRRSHCLDLVRLEDRTAPATIEVTNLADAGGGSLRQAILDANDESTHPGPDTIVFPTGGGTVRLSTIAGTQFGPNALEVTSAITILGNGVTITRVPLTERGSVQFYRLFFVTEAGNLTIRDTTLTNGLARGGNGGEHNGKSGGGGGGGLGAGGAIYNRGTLSIERSTFTGNTARGGNGGRGGQNVGTSTGATGGGGMGGNGGGTPTNGVTGHAGGGGFFGNGAAGAGDIGGGGGGSINNATGQTGGSVNGGRGGNSGGGAGSAGGLGGGGGGAGGGFFTANNGGDGGIGGGGGGGFLNGGKGGFGGGGGGAFASIDLGGKGGFGGGGGGRAGGAGFGGGNGGSSSSSLVSSGGGGGAGMGGAIFNDGGTLTISNSTISGNTTIGGTGGTGTTAAEKGTAGSGFGGGIFNLKGTVSVRNSTIADNTANRAVGIMSSGAVNVGLETGFATVFLNNSILSHPLGTSPLDDFHETAGSTSSGTGNLIREFFDSFGGTVASTDDPLLGPLANNGGLTFTRMPQTGSPAIDAGDNAAAVGLTSDQRGGTSVRIFNGKVDIGAVEVQPAFVVRPVLAGGALNGNARTLMPTTGQLQLGSTVPFFPGSTVNVRTAVADVTGDGIADFIGGTGPSSATKVVVINGVTGKTVATIAPFEAAFKGGVFVASGDFDGDGVADLVVTPDQGGGPIAAIYSGAKLAAGLTNDAAQFRRFFAIEDPFFRGGARPAVGDLNGDGRADLIVSAGFLGGPRIAIYNGASLPDAKTFPIHLVADFFAFEQTLRNGAFVAVGDMNGDGFADIFFGAGPAGGPRVRLIDGAKLLAAGSFGNLDAISGKAQLANFFAGDNTLRGGVRLAITDTDDNGIPDLVTGSGDREPSRVRVFKSANLFGNPNPTADQTLDPFGAILADGVYVG